VTEGISPFTKRESSEARNTYAGASSAGCAGRPAHRIVFAELRGIRAAETRHDEWRPDRARGDGIDANPTLHEVLGERLGERHDGALGCGIREKLR
jgi:hypothetical protein